MLVTRYRHVKKKGSLKTSAPFFTCHAKCTLPGCHQFEIKIQDAPVDGNVTAVVSKYGEENASHSAFHSHRYLRGKRRSVIGEQVNKEGAYTVRQEMIDKTPAEQLADGNLTEAPPAHILRQAAYERRKAERHSVDWAEDLMSTMEISKAEDMNSKKLPGGIHFIGKYPLVVMLYREHFLKKYVANPTTLHIDATGSVSRQMGEKTPYLYVVIAEHPNGSYPVAHMLSETHTVPSIEHFLLQVARHFKEVTGKSWTPPRIVTDFSWALLHAVSEGVCKKTLKAYLQECWDNQKNGAHPSLSKLSLCGAHISHGFASVLKTQKVTKTASAAFMWMFCRMQKASSLSELDKLFEQLCVLACSKGEVKLALHPPTEDVSEYDDHSMPEPNSTYRTGTAYGRHFQQVKEHAPLEHGAGEEVKNAYFYPGVVEYMLSTLMPLAPLWSQLITTAVTTNAAVESYMRVLKKQILRGRTRLHPGDLARMIMKDTASRMKTDSIPPKPAPRGKKRKQGEKEQPLQASETQEETWKKRDCSKRPTWYARERPPTDVFMDSENEDHDLINIVVDSGATTSTAHEADDAAPTEQKTSLTASQTADESTHVMSTEDEMRRCLKPRTWLTDDVIDCFCLSAASRSCGGAASFTVHWLTAMGAGRATKTIRLCLQDANAHKAKVWLMPYHRHGNHWALFVVSFQHQVIVHLDGMHGNADAATVQHVQRLVETAIKLHSGPRKPERCGWWSRWRLVNPACIPPQQDTYSCGTRVCFYAEIAATGAVTMPFNDQDMRVVIGDAINGSQVIIVQLHITSHQ